MTKQGIVKLTVVLAIIPFLVQQAGWAGCDFLRPASFLGRTDKRNSIIPAEQIAILRETAEKGLPRGAIGWGGVYRDIAVEEIVSSAVEGMGPAASFRDRLFYVRHILRAIYPNNQEVYTLVLERQLSHFYKGIIKMLLDGENLKILLGERNARALEILSSKAMAGDQDAKRELEEISKGLVVLAEKTARPVISMLREKYKWIPNSHIYLKLDIETITMAFSAWPGLKLSPQVQKFLSRPVMFVAPRKDLDAFRASASHELVHSREVLAGCDAFSLLRLEDNVFQSASVGETLSGSRLIDPRSTKFQGTKHAAGEWVKWRQAEYTSGGIALRWENMGKLVTEEDWTYTEAWNVAAIASGFAEQNHLPRQAAYDVVRLNLSSQIQPADQRFFGLNNDDPLPLHQAALIVSEKYRSLLLTGASQQIGRFARETSRNI